MLENAPREAVRIAQGRTSLSQAPDGQISPLDSLSFDRTALADVKVAAKFGLLALGQLARAMKVQHSLIAFAAHGSTLLIPYSVSSRARMVRLA